MELGNALNWFEIPVEDFNRAKKFYEAIFNFQMPESTMGPAHMGFFYTMSKGVKQEVRLYTTPDFILQLKTGRLSI